MARGSSVLFILAFGGILGCVPRAPGTPAPDFKTSFDSVPPDSILRYIGKLKFDRRKGDEKRLMVGDCPACRPGPLVAIHPEKNTHKNKAQHLAVGPGRIIARLINRDNQAYPKFNLGPRDTVYWAVYQVTPVNDTLSRGRSLFISLQGLRGTRDTVALPRDLYIEEHPRGVERRPGAPHWDRAIAKWELNNKGDMMGWNNCKYVGCCRP